MSQPGAAVGSSGGTLPCTEPPLTPTRPRGAQQVCRAQSTSPPALCTPGGSGPHLGNGALGKMTPSSNVLWPSASTHLAHTCVSHSAVPAPTCWPEFLHRSDLWRQPPGMCPLRPPAPTGPPGWRTCWPATRGRHVVLKHTGHSASPAAFYSRKQGSSVDVPPLKVPSISINHAGTTSRPVLEFTPTVQTFSLVAL